MAVSRAFTKPRVIPCIQTGKLCPDAGRSESACEAPAVYHGRHHRHGGQRSHFRRSVPMRLLLLSDDPVALDSVFCRLVHLDPQLVPTNVQGEQMGLGTWREENIELLTEEGPVELPGR